MGRKSNINQEVKDEILKKVAAGERVKDLAESYGVSTKAIYYWLKKGTTGERDQTLEIGRLRRENEVLYKILGQLTYKDELRKKKGYNL